MPKNLLIAASLLLLGCGQLPPPAELPERRLSLVEVGTDNPTELALAQAAAHYIESHAGCALWAGVEGVQPIPYVDVVPNPQITQVQFLPVDEIRSYYGDEVIGYADPQGGGWRLLVGSTLTDSGKFVVSVHELLHSLGLGHVEEPSNVLRPSLNGKDWNILPEHVDRLRDMCWEGM